MNKYNASLQITFIIIAAFVITLIHARFTASPILMFAALLTVLLFIYLPNIITSVDWITPRRIQRQRKASLYKARAFLEPYKNIMGNHTLSNKYCTVKFTNKTYIKRISNNIC